MKYILRYEYEAYNEDALGSPQSCNLRLSVGTDNVPDRKLARLFRDISNAYTRYVGCRIADGWNEAFSMDNPLNSSNGRMQGGNLYGK